MTQASKQPDESMPVAGLLTRDPADDRMWRLADGTPMAMAPPGWRRNALLQKLRTVIRNEGGPMLDSIGFRTPLLDLYRSTCLHPGTAA